MSTTRSGEGHRTRWSERLGRLGILGAVASSLFLAGGAFFYSLGVAQRFRRFEANRTVEVPETLTARNLVLVDGDGDVRAGMRITEDDKVAFSMFDPDSDARLDLVLSGSGTSGLTIRGESGVRASLMVTDEGVGSLALVGPTGRTRAAVCYGPGEDVGVVLSNADRTKGIDISIDQEGEPGIALITRETLRLFLGLEKSHLAQSPAMVEGRLRVYDMLGVEAGVFPDDD